MSSNKKKKTWEENEAPVGRWIGAAAYALIVGLFLGSVLNWVVRILPVWSEGMFLAPWKGFFDNMSLFSGLFIGCVLGIRFVCRTSLRAFLFGRGRKPDVKAAMIAGALMFAGMLAGSVPSMKNYALDNTDATVIAVNLVFCLAFTWIQTSTEEIFVRGFFLRAPYKNEIPQLPKGLLFAFISSLLFMAVHLANPEVTSQKLGPDLVLGAASYFVSAFCMYICNLLIGGMEAGLIFHLINNFFCFFLVRAKITALTTPTIIIDNSETSTGVVAFIVELIMFAPPLIYLIMRKRRQPRSDS